MKIKMRFFSLLQNFLLIFGIYARPRKIPSNNFIFDYLEAKNVALELIMVGDGTDGTYVLPNDLAGVEFCFSPGVGPTSQFEEFLYDHFKIKSFLIDASVEKVPSSRTDFYNFEKKFLGAFTHADTVCLKDWVNEKVGALSQDLLLQMDIEGAEYASILESDDDTLKRFRIIALELHGLDLLNNQVFASMFEQVLRKLSQNFIVCFARANDCCGEVSIGGTKLPRVMELTLIRKDRVHSIVNDPIRSFAIAN